MWALFRWLRFLCSSQKYVAHLSCWTNSFFSILIKFKLRFCLWECKWIRTNNIYLNNVNESEQITCISRTKAVCPTTGFYSNCRISTGCATLPVYRQLVWVAGFPDSVDTQWQNRDSRNPRKGVWPRKNLPANPGVRRTWKLQTLKLTPGRQGALGT